jgi:SAM-dependent methyltransferase
MAATPEGDRVRTSTERPHEDEIQRLYAARFSERSRASKARLWSVLYDAVLSKYVPADATVVDLGAGFCDFINSVRARRRIAIDLNPDTRRHAAEGVEVFAVPLDRLDDVVEPASVDVVLASNVFEHLPNPDALLRTLRAVRRVLKPRGRLLVLQPNVRLVGGAFWDFFDHTLPLTERGMTEALTVAGLRVVECRPRFLPYTTTGRLPHSPMLLRIYLALRPAQWLLGKQMLVVAERSE